MGAYCSYFYNGIYIDSTKNDIETSILSLIENDDIRKTTYKETPNYIVEHYDLGEIDEDGNETIYTCIQVDKLILLDRLNIKGYTFEFSKKIFNLYLEHEKERLEQSEYDFRIYRLNILNTITFDAWIKNLKIIQKNKINRFNYDNKYEDSNVLLHYMLTNEWYGFEGFDICIFLRLLLEISNDGLLVCDITDLLLSGYIDEDYIDNKRELYFKSDKIIILTEGKSDIEILSRTLKLLYPHLYKYFAFMDFDGAKIAGGAGPLTGIIKSFAGVGISNKTIALFDNDTAARAATKQLNKITLPSNIKVMYLPAIERLDNYPTIGPTGVIDMNINEMAASIEMYLGQDVLLNKISDLYHPIQWIGFDAGLSRYQGEITEKDSIQKEYKKILKICEENPLEITKYDFKDIRLVLECLFRSFNEFEQGLILEEINEYYEW